MLSRRNFIKGIGVVAATPLITNANIPVANASSHKVLTCNIRVDLPEDERAGFGWKARKDLCVAVIKKQQPDIICMQEVLRNQNEDLKKAFKDYFSFGFEGPEMDAFKEGYHGIAKNPVFFSLKRYELLAAGGYWLSETPLIAGSLSWDTARARHANWVRLKDKRSGKDFRVVNLHLDHKSQPAKEGQIKVILEESAQYASDYPQVLTGDFNASAVNPVYELVKAGAWKDTYTMIHGEAEPGYTIHEFQGEQYTKKDKGKKIDFIFLRGNVKPVAAAIIRDSANNRYPSDHYFVSAEVII